ncbi:MAG TPA: 23S rRNA (pseudouridine(1915)-N(3))-methyltransferase RlmH [bacterium]|nr:23S rRNA (pseudouridine(1915)-N(3))-methyltransferase RlmH [bacterium]
MKVRLLTVSGRQPRWVGEGCAEYEKRLPRAWRFELVEVKPLARSGSVPREKVWQGEAERLRQVIPKGSLVVALDERGASWSTARFAQQFDRWRQSGRDLTFVIGGADGFDPGFRDAADARLSLSPMTMPHGLVRVVFLEQLYRAATVLDGHPYHK